MLDIEITLVDATPWSQTFNTLLLLNVCDYHALLKTFATFCKESQSMVSTFIYVKDHIIDCFVFIYHKILFCEQNIDSPKVGGGGGGGGGCAPTGPMSMWSLIDCNSTVIQVMAWCRQATSHYLDQYWPKYTWITLRNIILTLQSLH